MSFLYFCACVLSCFLSLFLRAFPSIVADVRIVVTL